jgi:hypothetical protein
LKWQPGSSYEYDLEGSTVLSIPVSTDEQQLSLKGKVTLTVISKCEAAVTLSGFQPVNSDGEVKQENFRSRTLYIKTKMCGVAN